MDLACFLEARAALRVQMLRGSCEVRERMAVHLITRRRVSNCTTLHVLAYLTS